MTKQSEVEESTFAGLCPVVGRRTFIAALGVISASAALAACGRPTPHHVVTIPQFTIRHDGRDVRCLYVDRLVGGARSGCLVIVLLHGAGADATQWFDIGISTAIDDAQLAGGIERVVAVAPDIADHSTALRLVTETLLPAIDPRFAPGHIAISGISRGAAVAVAATIARPDKIESLGLHSPALGATTGTLAGIDAPTWIDCGSSDTLAPHAHDAAIELTANGVDVTEHTWPGGHDRSYWRRHLPEYVAFHVDQAQRSIA